MANITDQFVTSFSELHINAAKVDNNIGDIAIRDFFADSVNVSDTNTTAVIIEGATVVIPDGSTDIQTLLVTDTTGTNLVFTYTGTGIAVTAVYDSVDDLVTALTLATSTFVSAQVPLVMEIGTLSNEATVIDTPTFGEQFRGKLRGQLDGGQLDTQLYWVPRNFVHGLLRDLAESGAPLSVGIKWNSDSTGANSEYVVFNSFVSSFGIDTTFDDVAKVSATLVVDGAEHFADDAE